MAKRILVWGALCAIATATGCRSKECPSCTCDGGPGAATTTAGTAPGAGTITPPGAAGTASAAAGESAETEPPPSAAKCLGSKCDESAGPPVEPPPGNRPGDLAAPRPGVSPVAPALPADLPPAGPLAPGLAAHLTRLPGDGKLVIVVQVDVRALFSAADVRSILGGLVEAVRREVPGDPNCLVELAAAVELVTLEAVDFPGGNDTAAAILEGDLDLPGLIECAVTVSGGKLPREAVAQAAQGYVELDRDFAAATLGPRTVVLGGPELVGPIRTGRPTRPLSSSAEIEAIRKAVGAGPAYVAAFGRDESGGRHDESFTGGASLRTTPRLGVAGSFTFAVPETAGEVVGEFTEMLTEMDQEQAEVLGALRRMPDGSSVAGDAAKLFEAVRQARLTLQDRTLGFEVWVPEGMTGAGLAASVGRAVPWLLFGEDRAAGSPPDDPGAGVEISR
ncbi:MAG: hypothetical protein GYA57_17695 [Myxococcales bacterium]|nr:hypothetical protein [Myxococcales bacterium]